MGNLRHCTKHKTLFLDIDYCKVCYKENDAMKRIEDIEARFGAVTLHEQLEQDFTWIVKTLKRIIKDGSI